MPEAQNSKVSPIVAIAAVSIIIFSAVGVGVMTGVIPNSLSKSEPAAPAATPQPVATPAPAPASAETPKTVASAPKKKHIEKQHVASAEPAPRIAATEPPPPPPAPRICANCGSVISVNAVKQKGEGSGLGAVGGAVVGGLLGNQVGSGRGRTAATVVGVAGGALAGNEVEKYAKSSQTYNVAVRMDDGSSRTFSYPSEPSFRSGDKVRIVEGKLVAQ
jgi:outer membrane lipoprotein SlyB